jgi:hypothetical protein
MRTRSRKSRRVHVYSVAPFLFLFLAVLLINVPTTQGQTWTQLATTGVPPSARGASGFAYDPATNQMILFGGEDSAGQNLNDVWNLSLGTPPQWTQLTPGGSPPAGRIGPGAVYDSANSRMIVFGGGLGHTAPCVNDLWVLSNANGVGATWTQLSPSGSTPAPRWGASAIYAPASNTMTIFGGNNCFSTSFNDVWVLSNANGLGGTPVWTQLSPAGTAPCACHSVSAVYDPGSNRMILYGFPSNPDQVWVLTNANGLGGTPAWIQLSPSTQGPPKTYTATVYDPSSNSMIVFGGIAGTAYVNDTWVLSNANGLGGTPYWTQLNPSGGPPAPRASMATVYDPSSQRMVVFGGGSNISSFNDTWTLALASSTSVQISSTSPPAGGNAGSATVRIFGNNFQSGATATLKGVGPDIVGTNTTVTTAINSSVLGTTFDLTGAAPGVRDVVVTNPDGSSATLLGGFTVQQGGAPQIWANIVGLDRIQIGKAQTYYVVVTNAGNVDSDPSLVSLSVPAGVQYVQLSGSELFSVGASSGPEYAIPSPNVSNDQILVFGTSGVPPGATQYAPVLLTLPFGASSSMKAAASASGTSFTITAALQQGLISLSFDDYSNLRGAPYIPFQSGCTQCYNQSVAQVNAWSNAATAYTNYQNAEIDKQLAVGKFGVAVAQAAFDLFFPLEDAIKQVSDPAFALLATNLLGQLSNASSLIAGDSAGSVLQQVGISDLALIGQATALLPGVPQNLQPLLKNVITKLVDLNQVLSSANSYEDAVNTAQAARASFFPVFDAYVAARQAYLDCLAQFCTSQPPPPPPPTPPGTTSLPIRGVSSIDPNDKTGYRGAGTLNYISGAASLPYSVYFANESTATAPAQQVVITDQLDLTKYDPTGFSFGVMGFGAQIAVALPHQTSFASTIDLRPTTDLLVTLNARLDPKTGLATWTFTSIDPATGQPPTDPTVGFLPPGGEGSVLFSVSPKQGLPTATQIQNQATITFDANAPIPTQTWLNTIDIDAPFSVVQALPPQEAQLTFPVSWSGTDKGTGVAFFDVYVSDNGGAFTIWQSHVTATSASYTGQATHTYGFYSVATDAVGNVEATKVIADSTTSTAATDFTPTATPSSLSLAPGQSGTVTITISPTGGFTQVVSFSCSGLPSEATCAFSPITVTPNVQPVTTVLTISTTALHVGSLDRRMRPNRPQRFYAASWAGSLLGLAGICLIRPRKRLRRSKLLTMLMIIVVAGGIVSCGGGGSGGTTTHTDPGTPGGQSTVTVTASGGVSHTVAVQLTVQ